MPRRRFAGLLLLFGLLVSVGSLACTSDDGSSPVDKLGARATDSTFERDVPYVPTSEEVVTHMLELAKVGPGDRLYDLGSGDGRIVIAAAQRYRVRATGIEIDPVRVWEARQNARAAGVTEWVTFRVGDLFEADFSDATVVTLYLLPDVNLKLRPLLFKQLEPGTRVVSHNFDMGAWPPDTTVQVGRSTVYRWTIPETPPDSLIS